MTKEQIEQMRNIMSIALIICGIILIMNPFMPRIAAIASLGVGTPIFIYTVWSLIYDYFASKKKK